MTPDHNASVQNRSASANSNTSPLVTVGIALYNHERYIRHCLESIVQQSYGNIEIIVIDDGSKDHSFQVARDYLSSQTIRPHRIETRENRGMCATLNEIISHANGKYISFVGSDDYWHSNKIARHAEFLEDHPELALVHSNSYIVDTDDNIIGKLDYANKLNSGRLFEAIAMGTGGINTPCHMYRTTVYDGIGLYDTQFTFEDTDFWLRLTRKYNVGFVNDTLSYYRIHAANYGREDHLLSFYNDELIRIFKKNIAEEPLRRTAVTRIYRKSTLRALRGFHPRYFMHFAFGWMKEML